MYSEITEQELRAQLQDKVRHTGNEEELYLVYRVLLALLDRNHPPYFGNDLIDPPYSR